VDGAAPGWPGLPLRALDFDSNSGEFRLGAPALDALGRLGSCLTQLALSGGVLLETTPTGGGQYPSGNAMLPQQRRGRAVGGWLH
jgi:hypothetical protein